MKDLFRPERIFQLAEPDLPLNLPPLKTLDGRLNNLPVQPTALVPDIIFARPITMTRWRRARSSSSPPGGTT
jgi:hypothetical protein